jgi:hypothetical protein
MFQPIHEPVDALVTFTPGAPYPTLRAFRWRRRRYDITSIESVRRCTATDPQEEAEPRTYGHFSSRWVRGAGSSPTSGVVTHGSLCYRVRVGSDDFELRLDPKRSQWVLEGLAVEIDGT